MAEAEKEPMSTEAFRAKKASGTENARKSSLPSKANATRASSENLSARDVTIDQRQEKVRLLREKQADERKKKNEDRRAAFEERKRQRELDEKAKWEAMKEQVLKQGSAPPKTGTGRKLPSIPTERPSTAGPTRPSSIPRLSRPATAVVAPSKNASRSSPGGSSADSSPASTPSSKVRSSLGGAKSVSASNLSSAPQRRASSGNTGHRPQSSSKPRHSISANKPASDQNSLVPGKPLSKAQSTSAIHNIGNSRKGSTTGLHKIGHSSAKKEKAENKPKAGMMDEASAKQALAERRRKAREEAERLAMLDKKRQEEERLKREEEERIRAEEEAKEEARMQELAKLLKQQEEERLKKAMEEKEKRDKEEAERLEAEARQREEERLVREEEERKSREEAERKAIEDEERRKQEEFERQERRRRVEQIMSRTRQTANTGAAEEAKPTLQVPPNNSQETKNLDTGDTKRKVNEILQKVKGLSGSQTNLAQIGHNEDATDTKDHSEGSSNEITDNPNGKDQSGTALSGIAIESDIAIMPSDCDNHNELSEEEMSHTVQSVSLNGEHSHCVNSTDEVNGNAGVISNGDRLAEGANFFGNVQNRSQENSTGGVSETKGQNDAVGFHLDDSGSMESTPNKSSLSVGMDNASVGDSVDGEVALNTKGPELLAQNGEDEDMLWAKAEHTMRAREAQIIEALENSGIVAEGDEDEGSEETYMWKVIEGKIEIAEAV